MTNTKINLDEEVDFYKGDDIDWIMQGGEKSTKRDILAAALPILMELYAECQDTDDFCVESYTSPFIGYLNSLIYEKDK